MSVFANVFEAPFNRLESVLNVCNKLSIMYNKHNIDHQKFNTLCNHINGEDNIEIFKMTFMYAKLMTVSVRPFKVIF